MPIELIRRVLQEFNAGLRDAESAACDLGISRAQLYRYRTQYLRDQDGYSPCGSGGDRYGRWPEEVCKFLDDFLPLQQPPNYQLIADELLRLHDFRRARSSVEAYVKAHYADQIPTPKRIPRVRRRFRRAYIGELWQHDSSIHQWWPGPSKQVLLLCCDDCSGLIVGGCFVTGDTTWNHFEFFRAAFTTWGIPEIIYTDALSLFGPSSATETSDPKSEFQRALRGLGVGHLVAPTPQAKGKIERRFGTLQRRLVTLMAYERVCDSHHANEILKREIDRQNQRVCRPLGRSPLSIWQEQTEQSTSKMRASPESSLLDLHLSLRASRRVNADHTIDFEGVNHQIGPTQCRRITIVHHPGRQFWAVEGKPKLVWPPILGHFTL